MGTTYTGTPKGYRIKPGIIRTPLYSNESISSWLIRAALDCGTEPITLTGYYWDKWRLWRYDLDKGFEPISPQIYEDITRLSLNQQVNLVNHSLYSVLKPINRENTLFKGQAKWVISRSSRNRSCRIGQFYCPYCLEEAPYLRNRWRLAWYFGCLEHQVLLESKCHSCGEPYQPHLLTAEKRQLNYCHQCGKRLEIVATLLNKAEIATMKTLDEVFATHSCECFGKYVNVQVYFDILRHFINLIRSAAIAKSTHAITKFVEQCGISQTEICQTKTALAFEQLPITERKNLLVNAMKILKLSDEDFIQAIQQSGITQKAFAFERYPQELDTLFKHAPEGKTVRRKTVTRKNKTNSISSMKRQWERLKRQLKIAS